MEKMIRYKCKPYNELKLDELYAIMVLRQEVFAVEQNCVYIDADNRDQACFHIIGEDEIGSIRSYSRICPRCVSYPAYGSIGRVVVDTKNRSHGEGYRLMEFTLSHFDALFPNEPCKISAQSYLLGFYKKLGFRSVGEAYLEDGISHMAMIRP